MSVYIDSLFMTNLFMDFVIIFVMCIMRRKEVNASRILLAAGLSALYGTLFFFPSFSFMYSAFLKILFSFVPVFISTRANGIKDFFISFAVFWFITLACGGVVFAISTMTDFGYVMQTMVSNCIMYVNLSPLVLGIGCGVLFILAECWRRNLIKAFTADKLIIPLELEYMGQKFEFRGLIDTGCELIEPLSGAPVIVAEKTIFKTIPLPDAEIGIGTAAGRGSLKLLLPEKIISRSDDYWVSQDAVVGITDARLSDYGVYNALINPAAVMMCRNLSNTKKLGGNKSEEIFI